MLELTARRPQRQATQVLIFLRNAGTASLYFVNHRVVLAPNAPDVGLQAFLFSQISSFL